MQTLNLQPGALIILCGASASGKTRFAVKHFRPSQVVSSDRCREMISDDPSDQTASPDAFDLFYTIIDYRLKRHRTTVADATNVLPHYRRQLTALAATYGRPAYLLMFDTPLDRCFEHDQTRTRRVDHDVIERQFNDFRTTKQHLAEGNKHYTAIYTLTPDQANAVGICWDGSANREESRPT